jgi:hypothetical protein
MTSGSHRRPSAPLLSLAAGALLLSASAPVHAQPAPAAPAAAAERDGSHDFDFLIGDWKARLRKLEKPLSGSNSWIEYEGISRTHKVLDTNANFEEFEVDGGKPGLHLKGQTLRLYNPETHEWSIYLIYADKGQLGLPPTVGKFRNGVGELYDMEVWNGRTILVRYQWNPNNGAPHFEQAFSMDGGKSWEVNWICDLVREK